MDIMYLLGLILAVCGLARALTTERREGDSALKLPFTTQGRDIIASDGSNFHFAATNWPGHQEGMIPEGLQYSSVADIVSKIKGFGLNSVRLTFAIEMVDQIYDKGADTSLQESLVVALGSENGTKVLDQILSFNPGFTAQTSRLEVFDAVAKELANQGLYLHLDNHVSKAFWCCGTNDGNGWFGETYFSVSNWTRGWSYIATHAKENWPSFSSVGLRNELRNANNAEPVDWYTWKVHMTAAADAVHEAAPEALIFFSGRDFDVDIRPIPLGLTLNGTVGTSSEGKTAVFNPSNFAYENKIVLEIHKYDFEATQDNCSYFGDKWYAKGFQALNAEDPATKYLFPVVISEWGFIQNGTYWNQTTYNRCLIEFVDKWQVSWMQWELSGSFYIQTRNGRSIQDLDEAWGLLNHNWTATRSPITVENSLDKLLAALGM